MSHNHVHANYAEANRTHFDKEAATYDDQPSAVELANRLGPHVLQAYPFDEDKTTVLDYACGTGLMSRQLISFVKSIVGVDISQGMVDQYNLRVFNQGITPEEMKAVCVELTGADGELEGQKFDVVVCSAAYHHFQDINKVTTMLARFLNPGGMLIVADIKQRDIPEQHTELFPQSVHHIVAHHHGVSKEAMETAFESAGMDEFQVKDVVSTRMRGKDVVFFLATGIKNL